MKYYTIPPPLSLQPFVQFYWVLESDAGPYTHRSMADVGPEMVFHYKGRFAELKDHEKNEPSFIAGVQTPSDKFRRFSIDRDFGIFGVYFYPYALPLLAGSSAIELRDQMIDLDHLFGQRGADLTERMITAVDNQRRVRIINEFLETRFANISLRHDTIFSAIQFVIRSAGDVRISDVADRFSLSQRQFQRKFKEYAGFTPKLFSRILRFHAAMEQYGVQHKSLTQIAFDCGYYDQSHFIHEFKQFSGYHPRTYFYGDAEGVAWR